MAGGYTRADIARMEQRLRALEDELKQTPERKRFIETEISNLKYAIREAKRRMR